MNFLTWQNLVMPGHKAVASYIHLPHPALGVSYEDGAGSGPQVWLVFWQPVTSDTSFIWDSSLVQARFGNTRLIRVAHGEELVVNLKKAGDLILSDPDVSPERSARNTLALAHLYASLADITRVQAMLDSGRDQLDSLGGRAREEVVDEAARTAQQRMFLVGTAETSLRLNP